jgi:signal transduction histidine kinase
VNSSLNLTLLLTTAAILLMAGFIVYFLYFYQKRQMENMREQERLRHEYEQELLKAQLEIQEDTLAQVGRELHDNIGQTLSLARLYLGDYESPAGREKAVRADGLVQDAIGGLRSLSASLNPDQVVRLSLTDAVRNLSDRISESGALETDFVAEGEPAKLDEQVTLMLYRMCQEVLGNAVRHAQATRLLVTMAWSASQLDISVKDDGKGFTPSSAVPPLSSSSPTGQGLTNLRRRAHLIGAALNIQSVPGKGTEVTITLPFSPTKTA